MKRLLIGLTSLCLLLLAGGCSSSPRAPQVLTPTVPSYLLKPLPAPARQVSHNRDLLQLLADYESLRRRANADRSAVAGILESGRESAE